MGSFVRFFVDLTNDGPSRATGVTARFKLPAGYTSRFVGLPEGDTYDPATGDWTIGALGTRN